MIKGEKIRLDIHNILYSIYKLNKNLNNSSIKKLINKHNKKDKSFINNVLLNSMRLHVHTSKIINKYINKKIGDHEKILLISSITQIVFLNFKEYAVINCSVEVAKKLNVYHGFINAILRKILKDKDKLKDIKVNFIDLPNWFKKEVGFLSKTEKTTFLKNFYKEPDIHIVFKNEYNLNKFDEDLIKTSPISGFLLNKKNIKNKKSFVNGDWWVQDFSSFFPLYNYKKKESDRKFLDACAAPGGKSFQLLSKKFDLVTNDKSSTRIKILKDNFKRLKFDAKILNKDFIKFDERDKYDLIVIDAPCSAIGTIRKNPEILFKNKGPDFIKLINLQEKMLDKASFLINKHGSILYMTCSFLKEETVKQIEKFLKKNSNFQLSNFKLINKDKIYSKLIKDNLMITLPDNILNKSIDGYFAAYLRRTK